MDDERLARIERSNAQILDLVEEMTGAIQRLEESHRGTRGRVEVCIDALGAFRFDYLRDHPRHEAS